MKEIRKEDIKQEVFDLYDQYAHNQIDRRTFMDKLSTYAVGGLTVPGILAFLLPKYASAKQIK
ncbi:MAG: dienelactone hydrolase family protein, partial [Cyclobacteriaceae bacterium]|nr:dienelactone hydrolase family protein [Cyclobacteriaceae bacterium]